MRTLSRRNLSTARSCFSAPEALSRVVRRRRSGVGFRYRVLLTTVFAPLPPFSVCPDDSFFFFSTFLALRHIFRATVSLGQRAAAVTTLAPCEGLLRLESRAAGVVICSLVRFFASKQTPPVLRLVLFFPALRFFVLGFALRHGSQFAVSPRFEPTSHAAHRPAVSRR
jgi:hypothetical protein